VASFSDFEETRNMGTDGILLEGTHNISGLTIRSNRESCENVISLLLHLFIALLI
jgi:hypothetical protein